MMDKPSLLPPSAARLRTVIALHCPALVFSALLVLAGPVFAQSSGTLEELSTLVANRQYEQAYTLALQLRAGNEGDPNFDFPYGMAALETGHANEAVFAFERIVHVYPDQQRVKLELARAFYQSNNLESSRELFNEVLAENPEENVRDNINAFVQAIDERERNAAGRFSWFVNTNVGSDSNINSATELGVITTPIGDIELSANGKRMDDNFFDVGGGAAFSKPLSKTSGFNVAAMFNRHDNIGGDDFDLNVLSADANYSHTIDSVRLSYGVRGQLIELNEQRFQDSNSFIATLQQARGNGWSRALTGAYTTVRYDTGRDSDANLRDVNQYLISGMVGKVMGRFSHSFSVYYGDEDARQALGKNNAQRFYGVAFAEQYQLRANHLPYFRISLHESDNKADAPIFSAVNGIKRQDTTLSTSFGWLWRAGRFANVTTDLTYTDNESNLDLFSYDRLKFQTGLRYQF